MKDLKLDLGLSLVRQEFILACTKFPPFASQHEGFAILLEEVDEMWSAIKANRRDEAVEEAIQVAAMALRFILDVGKEPH